MPDGLGFIIRTKQDMADAVQTVGFLPLFRNSVPGFSIEERAAPEAWFSGESGVWEWKGPVIRETGCAYGKFFEKKAAFVSAEWFPDFANFRRDGYDFDARFDDGLASFQDKALFELVDANAPIVSKRLKELGDYRKGGRKGFDTSMSRLQAQCYCVISDFVYPADKRGKQYGWGVAEYSTPEKFMGNRFAEAVYQRTPEESRRRVSEYLRRLLPHATEAAIQKFLR